MNREIPEFSFVHNPPPIWRITIKSVELVIETPNHCSWWFRFWVKVFFGGKWERL